MARPVKKIVKQIEEPKEVDTVSIDTLEFCYALQTRINELVEQIRDIEKKLEKPKITSINKMEKFNDEVASTIESYHGMKMEESDKIISMRNAIKILPPNMVADGRHVKENIEAICGFKISDEMMDEAYEGIVHDPL